MQLRHLTKVDSGKICARHSGVESPMIAFTNQQKEFVANSVVNKLIVHEELANQKCVNESSDVAELMTQFTTPH